MPTVHQTIQMRKRRRLKASRNPTLSFGLLACGIVGLLIAIGALLLGIDYVNLTEDLPSVEALPDLIEPPGGKLLLPTRVYDRTGEHLIFSIQNAASGEREYLYYLTPEKTTASAGDGTFLPSNLITTTIVVTDPGFFSHPGVTITSLIQNNPKTIAQRLASDLLLDDEPVGLRRDLRSSLLAMQIIRRFGHQKALEWYINSTSYGNLAFGAQAASQLYFGKPAASIDLAEAAMLAVASQDPVINPWDSPIAAQQRQKQVIQQALQMRMISPSEGVQAIKSESKVTPSISRDARIIYKDINSNVSTAFIDLVLDQLKTRIPTDELERGGLRVLTTLDLDLQSQAACASRTQNSRVMTAPGQDPAGIPVDCPAARLLPALPTGSNTSVEDLSSEVIVIDPGTGQILALNGDKPSGIENQILPVHPAGSLASLFVYMTGFTRGFSPASLVWDIPATNGSEPQKQDKDYHGPVRLRTAFANDYLTPVDSVLSQIGVENVWRTTQQLGIQTPENGGEKPDSSYTLLRPLNLVEVTHALSTFANQGTIAGRALETSSLDSSDSPSGSLSLDPIKPTAVLRVEDLNGRVRMDWSNPQARPILTSQLAYLMTNILSDETARWPSLGHPNPLEIGRPAAAKISITPDGNSNWVIGYTPHRIVGVWMGVPEDQFQMVTPTTVDMRNAAAGIWHAVMQYTSQGLAYDTFSIPSGLSFIQVCDPSGLLPTAACPNVVEEVFLNGNEPVQIDTLYRLVSINRESGELATIFTSPDLLEQRSYISIPPEAEDWAQLSGLEIPPSSYDSLPAPSAGWPATRITSPKMLDNLHGKILITGIAAGEDFSFYRVQYGKGPAPIQWFQIGEDKNQPVSGGALVEWDTSEMEGLYSLQLLVVRQDQSAERSTIFVTIDNEQPKIEILSPTSAEVIQQEVRPKIVLQAQITDQMNLKTVLFKIDDQIVASLMQPPYAISWSAVPGDHIFEVIATDEAGNSNQAEIEFSVQ